MNTVNKKTILVVDDVPENIAVLEAILKDQYRVKAATSGEAALWIARSQAPPDLILLDVMMPGMDGFEVCRSLKQDEAGASIPVIFLTSRTRADDESTGFEAGAVDYIQKPVDPEIVLTRVKAHLEMKEEALRVSEIRYRRLFETAKDGILILEAETGRIIDANPSLLGMFRLEGETSLGRKIWDLGILRSLGEGPEILGSLLRKDSFSNKHLSLETANGQPIDVELSGTVLKANGRDVIQCNFRDISTRMAAERQRDELGARLSHYLHTSPTVTYALRLKEGAAEWRWVSENVQSLLGYSSAEVLEPGWWFRCVHASDRQRAVKGIAELTESETYAQEYRFRKKNHDIAWIRDEMRIAKGEGPETEIIGTLTEVTGRKTAEAELSLKSAALESAANAIVITDREGLIEWVNEAFGKLTGYSRAEALGKNPRELVYSGKQDKRFYTNLWDTILAGKVWSGELTNRRKSGELYAEEMTITPVLDEERHIEHFIAIKSDTTERRQSRERLEATLVEKDILLREIHHRVKNNLQLIISLLTLSGRRQADEAPQEFIETFIERVQTMAYIHEQFYASRDVSRIDFTAFLSRLVDNFRGAAATEGRVTEISCDIDEVTLSLEKAIPAGLAANELLLSALDRAGTKGLSRATINLSLRLVADKEIELVVHDIAEPPVAAKPEDGKSMNGLLVDTLTAQLGGTIKLTHIDGHEALLKFPLTLDDVRENTSILRMDGQKGDHND